MSIALLTSADGQLTWTAVLLVLGGVGAVVLILWGISRLLPDSGQYRTAGGNALVRLDAFFHPSTEHVIEAREHEEKEDAESGDPPRT